MTKERRMSRDQFCKLFFPGYGPLVDIGRTGSLNPLDWSTATKIGLGIQTSAAALTACAPKTKEPTSLPYNLPDRLKSQGNFDSTPEWSSERDYDISTTSGSIRVFNASSWEVDTALLAEMVNRHCNGISFSKSVDLRIFNDTFVVRDDQRGFALSDTGGDIGLTVHGTNIVWSVIPTGWASIAKHYEGGHEGLETVVTTPGGYITMDMAHELIVHGCNRAANIQRHDDEELHAQIFERDIHHTLLNQNRTLVR
jgi:hypothetical protein